MKKEVSCVTCMYLDFSTKIPYCIFDHKCDLTDFDCLKDIEERPCYKQITLVKVEEILELKRKITEFNRLDINQIRFIYKDKVINIDKDIIGEFEYSGLLNTNFLTMFNWEGEL